MAILMANREEFAQALLYQRAAHEARPAALVIDETYGNKWRGMLSKLKPPAPQ